MPDLKEKSTIDKLLEACRGISGLDPRDPLDAVADPHWDEASRTNDWRNCVDDDVIFVWDSLSLDAKLVAYLQGASRSFFDE